MRILVGWDDPQDVELVQLYLDVAENQVEVCGDAAALYARAMHGEPWDAVLLSTALPTADVSLDLCRQLQRAVPLCPIIGACPPHDVFHMAGFLSSGMRQFVVRDAARDYLFVLHATVQGAVHSARAEREQRLAERLREEINAVHRLQQAIVPRDIDCPDGYRIRARYESSQIHVLGGQPVVMAGGDYCDVFALDDHTYVVLVADASGHGMPACLAIMIMQALVRMMLDSPLRGRPGAVAEPPLPAGGIGIDPSRFLAEVNRRLCQQNVIGDWGGFITLLYGILRTDRHELHWASAGHPPPLWHDLTADRIERIASHRAGGFPLGISEQSAYETYRFAVPPRSRLLLYTDGLTEAFPTGDVAHREFGLDGIIATLRACRRQMVDEALGQLFRCSYAFTNGHGRHDDTSVVLIERGEVRSQESGVRSQESGVRGQNVDVEGPMRKRRLSDS